MKRVALLFSEYLELDNLKKDEYFEEWLLLCLE